MDHPHVVWLTIESLRADHTPMYGYERVTTPNLARLSHRDDAHVFRHGVAASNWTLSSSASMLTGTHVSTHHAGADAASGSPLRSDIDTIAEMLPESYQSALFSSVSWIGPETGLNRGFDQYEYVRMEPSNFLGIGPNARDSWRCLFHHFRGQPTANIEKLKRDLHDDKDFLLAKAITRWLKGRDDPGQPLFLYAHLFSPHHRYAPPRCALTQFDQNLEIPQRDAFEVSRRVFDDVESIKETIALGPELSEAEWQALRLLYDAEIFYADQRAQEILDAIDRYTDGDLLIIVTGDHGDLFGEYNLIGHQLALHDGLIRVPMMTVGIDDIADGPTEMSQHVDLTRTIGNILDVDTTQFEGRDLRDSVRPVAISQRGRERLDEFRQLNPAFGDQDWIIEEPMTAMSTPAYKLVDGGNTRLLYKRPDESREVSAEAPDQFETLSETLSRLDINWPETVAGTDFDADTAEQLRDLGYLA